MGGGRCGRDEEWVGGVFGGGVAGMGREGWVCRDEVVGCRVLCGLGGGSGAG